MDINQLINLMQITTKKDCKIFKHEQEVSQKILEILKESDITVIRATVVLNFCINAVQFSKV